MTPLALSATTWCLRRFSGCQPDATSRGSTLVSPAEGRPKRHHPSTTDLPQRLIDLSLHSDPLHLGLLPRGTVWHRSHVPLSLPGTTRGGSPPLPDPLPPTPTVKTRVAVSDTCRAENSIDAPGLYIWCDGQPRRFPVSTLQSENESETFWLTTTSYKYI